MDKLVHKQVRPPAWIINSGKSLDISQVIGSLGQTLKMESGLLGSPVTLLVVAVDAGTHQVFPSVCATMLFGDYMIHSHRRGYPAAILAAMTIPLDNILPRKKNPLTRSVNIEAQANHRRYRILFENGAYHFAVPWLDHLGLTQKY